MGEDLHALFAMLRDRLAETVEAGDAELFRVHDPVAVVVAQHATLQEAGARGGKAEVGDLGARAFRGAGFGVLTDVAGEDDDVLHG